MNVNDLMSIKKGTKLRIIGELHHGHGDSMGKVVTVKHIDFDDTNFSIIVDGLDWHYKLDDDLCCILLPMGVDNNFENMAKVIEIVEPSITQIRFLSEVDKDIFRSHGRANRLIANHMGSDWNRVSFNGNRWYLVDKNNEDIVIDNGGVSPSIIPSEYKFFEWDILPVEKKKSIKELWDILNQKKAEYDNAFMEYNEALMENYV